MSRSLVRNLVVLALLAAPVALFFACFERRETEVEVGASREARRNPYLALARLLERMGKPVVVFDDPVRLEQLPPPPATLILPTSRLSLSDVRSEALLDWVEAGGHLVVVTYSMWGEPDRRADLILDRFDLRQHLAAPGEGEDDDAEAESEDAEPASPSSASEAASTFETETAEAWFAELEQPLEVEFAQQFVWEDPKELAVWTVAGAEGAHLIELRHGAGLIDALTDELFLRNDKIDRADHAEFVLRLLPSGEGEPRPVWILFAEEWPGLLALVRERAWPALISLGVLLALMLWRPLLRFGPLLPAPSPERRRWMEHLEAAGRFHWRHDRGRSLIDAMRAAVLLEVRERHPALGKRGARELADRLAAASGLRVAEVARALDGPVASARDLVAAVAALEKIRASV